ncbi:FAD-binding protein [Nocardioides sambongensis]|uniref:FAD-binding protein n=1 Tax=Nocardioides sambongensis TaxID=2589074 RepID=UPI00112DBB67|nr:FAD-binding protein [Nocardioides sambongensis]
MTTETHDPSTEQTYDVIVVGSGGGALTAAWTAARAGLEVLVAEATDLLGGTTAYSGGGVWFPGNRLIREQVDANDGAAAQEYFRAVVGDRTDSSVQDAFLEGGPRLVDALLDDEAFEFEPMWWPDYYGAIPGASVKRQLRPLPLARETLGDLGALLRPPLKVERGGVPAADELAGGQALIGRLLLALSRLPNATLRTSMPVVGLETEGGAVVGVRVQSTGDRSEPTLLRVRRGVVIAAGGFEQSDSLRTEYGVPGSTAGSMGCAGNHGLALQAAVALGADVDLMDQAWWAPGITHPDGTTSFSLWFTAGIFVDHDGRRFVNESWPYDRLGRAVIDAQREDRVGTGPAGYWMVYDDREGDMPPVRSTTVPIGDPADYRRAGLWHTADTLDELAAAIGVPAGALTETVARYNDQVAEGRDTDFGRGDEPYDRAFSGGESPLVSVEKGPFHAVAFGLSDLGTKGGLRTDADGGVLDAAGARIPGLYAAGNSMAAVSGTTYPGGGNPIAASMVFGHLAALDLAATR